MTRFEKDKNTILNNINEGLEILRTRKEELNNLLHEGKTEKNSWRRDIIAQEYLKKQKEYNKLSELI